MSLLQGWRDWWVSIYLCKTILDCLFSKMEHDLRDLQVTRADHIKSFFQFSMPQSPIFYFVVNGTVRHIRRNPSSKCFHTDAFHSVALTNGLCNWRRLISSIHSTLHCRCLINPWCSWQREHWTYLEAEDNWVKLMAYDLYTLYP